MSDSKLAQTLSRIQNHPPFQGLGHSCTPTPHPQHHSPTVGDSPYTHTKQPRSMPGPLPSSVPPIAPVNMYPVSSPPSSSPHAVHAPNAPPQPLSPPASSSPTHYHHRHHTTVHLACAHPRMITTIHIHPSSCPKWSFSHKTTTAKI